MPKRPAWAGALEERGGIFGRIAAGPAVTSGNGTPAAIAIAEAVVWMVGTAVVQSALNALFQAALYRYAADGKAVGPFTAEIMGSAFAPKR